MRSVSSRPTMGTDWGENVTHGPPTISVELESRPESLTLVRSMLAGVAELLAFEPELLVDLKTAVSEACNNVVLHAYGGASGPLVVELNVADGDVEIAVCDRGSGIQQVASPSEDRMGVGLAVISALADRAEFLSGPEGGTEVRMLFAGRGAGVKLAPSMADGGEELPLNLSGDVVVKLSSVALLGGVLGRVARALAAGARFSLDRFSDVYLVTDALAGYAEVAANTSQVSFASTVANRRLEIIVGPFPGGSGEELKRKHSDSPLALLTDELSVEPSATLELLRVVMVDHRDDSGDEAH